MTTQADLAEWQRIMDRLQHAAEAIADVPGQQGAIEDRLNDAAAALESAISLWTAREPRDSQEEQTAGAQS